MPLSLLNRFSGPIARATLRTSGVLGIRLLVQAGNLFLLARLLGPGHFGEFASLAALGMFLGNLATFGTHITLVRDLARDAGRRSEVLPAALGTTVFCGAALLLCYLAVSTVLLDAHASVGLAAVLCIGVAELIVQPLLTISAVERMSVGQIAGTQFLRMLPLPLQLLVAVSLLIVDIDSPFTFYAFGHLVAAAAALMISLRMLSTPWPRLRHWVLPDRGRWRDSGGFALVALTASGPTELDKTLAARLMPLELAGLYSAASRIAGAMTIPVSSMMLSALPSLFRDSGRGSSQLRLTGWIFACGLGYGAFAAASLWFLAPILQRPFGPDFVGVSDGMRWLALAIPGLCLRLTGANVLMSTDRPLIRAGIEMTGLMVLFGCSISLAPYLGTKGMALAVVCAETIMALLGWGWILRRMVRA